MAYFRKQAIWKIKKETYFGISSISSSLSLLHETDKTPNTKTNKLITLIEFLNIII